MPSQKAPKEKKAHELTTDEAMERLFHPDVIAHAKRHASEPPRKKGDPKSMSEH